MSWLVLVNPNAGIGRRVVERVHRSLALHEVDGEIVVTPSHAALAEVLDSAQEAQRHRFVAVGGDGTVNVVVNALLERQFDSVPLLGVLPAGTGCDLLRTFAISQKMEEAAAHLSGDTVYPIDVGIIEGEWGVRHFVNVGNAGIVADAARRAQVMSPRLGRTRYLAAFGAALPRFKGTEVRVIAGRREYSGRALAVVFANAQFFGGGFNIAPKAAMMDGDLDIQVFTCAKPAAARLVPKVVKGLHLTDRAVRRFVSPDVRIETESPWPVEVDGEYVGNTPVVARVAKGRIALKI